MARVWFDQGQVLVARDLLLLVLDVTRRVRLCVELVLVYLRLIDVVVHARSRWELVPLIRSLQSLLHIFIWCLLISCHLLPLAVVGVIYTHTLQLAAELLRRDSQTFIDNADVDNLFDSILDFVCRWVFWLLCCSVFPVSKDVLAFCTGLNKLHCRLVDDFTRRGWAIVQDDLWLGWVQVLILQHIVCWSAADQSNFAIVIYILLCVTQHLDFPTSCWEWLLG